ncbi:MAG: hypothetical protein MUO33_10865 [Sedimentisphaerales bacterium]|jgi:hypothetical protein|nr:hypothetical protein [Sedimentisphaerales bacterium]
MRSVTKPTVIRQRRIALRQGRTWTAWLFTFAFILYGLILLLGGCRSCDQPGETTAEGRRRHERALRVNQQEMMVDIDRALLLDKPSKLTDMRIP